MILIIPPSKVLEVLKRTRSLYVLILAKGELHIILVTPTDIISKDNLIDNMVYIIIYSLVQ